MISITCGAKKDFRWRLETPDRLGQAGVDKIGLGALLGLGDWRTDSLMVARHLQYLRKTYWQSRYSISFPRLPALYHGFQPEHPMNDRQLLQLICAYRLFDPEVELSSLNPRRTGVPRFPDESGYHHHERRVPKPSRVAMPKIIRSWSSLRSVMSAVPSGGVCHSKAGDGSDLAGIQPATLA